ncbi:MAG TPA: SRPBCC family protein [Candidatus Macondimonas sp.]|nr:SRPBCC family protein [Candidatus Macondimonas sp.]
MTLTKPLVARATMLIRRPIEEVFNAFVDPTVTTKFWFSRSSGRLAPGEKVTWYWDQYGVSGEVTVTALEKNQRIVIEWPTPVEWTFTPKGNDATFVSIIASGFTGTDDEKVAQALDSTEGFNLVISACKALLEYGIDLRLVSDKIPDAAVSGT